MVSTNTTTETMANCMPLFSVSPTKLSKLNSDNFIQSVSSSLFNLSKPFNLSHKFNSDLNNSQYTNTTFTFPEPFESSHLNCGNGGGKLINKQNSKRQQPYSLARPKFNSNNNNNKSNDFIKASEESNNNNLSNESSLPNNQPQSNAILARLSNISNSFKSIFVRPKHTKPVDLDSFNQRLNNRNNSAAQVSNSGEGTKFKLKLFSVNTTSPEIQVEEPVSNDSSTTYKDMNQKLEKIISRNIMVESFTNKLSKTSASEAITQSPMSKIPKQSDSSSTISSMSSANSQSELESNSQPIMKHETPTRSSLSSKHHQRALQMSNNNSLIKSENNTSQYPKTPISSNTSGAISKWTCMVCLSKHTLDVKICSICGSANNDTVNKTSVQITLNYLSKNDNKNKKLMDMCDSPLNRSAQNPLRILNNTSSMKTWKCNDCNFANDNLKIVCMNCRASKKQHTKSLSAKLNHQSLQTKRKPNQIVDRSIQRDKFNRSNEENEQDSDHEAEQKQERSRKKFKVNSNTTEQFCKNCKNCLEVPSNQVEVDVKTPTTCGNNKCDQKKTLETPLRPKCFISEATPSDPSQSENEQAKESIITKETKLEDKTDSTRKASSIFSKIANSAKWSCSTCLVSNDSDKDACACCQTKRPRVESQTTTPLNGLIAAAKANASKWSCTACLTSNDSDKTTCACCTTKRPEVTSVDRTEKPKTGLFASATKPLDDKWSCSVCLVKNDSDKTACVCCSTNRSGSSTSSEPKTKFSSLVAAAGTLTNTPSAISFGINASKTEEKSSGNGIKFTSTSFFPSQSAATESEVKKSKSDSSNTISNPPTFSASGFSFGSKTSSEKTANEPIATSSGFSFGSKTSSEKTANEPIATSSGFSFGSKTSSEKTANEPIATSSGFSFGKKAEETEKKQEKQPLFGVNTSATPNNLPAFGSNNGAFSNSNTNNSSFLQGSNPFTNPTSNKDKAPEITKTEAPKLFGFQNSSSSVKKESEASKSFFGNSTDAAKPAFSFGGSAGEGNKQTFGSFGSSTTGITETSKSSFDFGNSTTTTTTEPSKPAFSFGNSNSTLSSKSVFGSSTNQEQPKLTFGSSNSSNSSGMFGATTTAKPADIFSNNKQEAAQPATNAFTFGKSQPTATPATPSAFNFGNAANTTSTSTFGANNTTTQNTAPATTNVFGQLNQNSATNKPAAFNFGKANANQANTPASSFTFGASDKKQPNDENKPLINSFNFGGAPTNTGFTFGGSNSTDSPLKPPVVPSQPSGSPFVFGGITNNSKQTTDSPSLTQILAGPPTTPSTTGRPIKKATRMRKK